MQSVGVQVADLTMAESPWAEPVLSDLNFQLAAGQRLAIVGPSGSGLTTRAEVLAGIVPQLAAARFGYGRAGVRRTGEFVVVTGVMGCGKSLLLQCVLGLTALEPAALRCVLGALATGLSLWRRSRSVPVAADLDPFALDPGGGQRLDDVLGGIAGYLDGREAFTDPHRPHG